MAKVNVSGCGHGSKVESYSGGLVVTYGPFPNDTPDARARLEKVQRAFSAVDRLAISQSATSACNVYFASLPKGSSFRQLWKDDRVFINYSPAAEEGRFATTHSNDRDIALTRWCIDHHNHWMIGATIVHEFAHIGGAPGGASHKAERAVRECGFIPQYDPDIRGSLQLLASFMERMA